MAMVLVGYRGYVTFMDNGAQETTRSYELVASTAADAATAMSAVLAALASVTDDAIVGYSFGPRYGSDSVSLPASGVENQNQALIETYIAGELTKVATYTIPAPKPAIFVATSGDGANQVDPTNAAVLAYQAIFQTGGQAYISDGEIAGNIKGGKRIHRASRRG